MSIYLQNRLRYSRERAPTSLLYDRGSRVLVWHSVSVSAARREGHGVVKLGVVRLEVAAGRRRRERLARPGLFVRKCRTRIEKGPFSSYLPTYRVFILMSNVCKITEIFLNFSKEFNTRNICNTLTSGYCRSIHTHFLKVRGGSFKFRHFLWQQIVCENLEISKYFTKFVKVYGDNNEF